jgi:hypothetical protein
MNLITFIIGLSALGYGIYTWISRKNNEKIFWKLKHMRKFWGERTGSLIHFISYTLLPIIFGIVIIIFSINGGSLF